MCFHKLHKHKKLLILLVLWCTVIWTKYGSSTKWTESNDFVTCTICILSIMTFNYSSALTYKIALVLPLYFKVALIIYICVFYTWNTMKQLLGIKAQKWIQKINLILHIPYKRFSSTGPLNLSGKHYICNLITGS
jgi:energy-coupling factor transporter transmembrane protein EcfT